MARAGASVVARDVVEAEAEGEELRHRRREIEDGSVDVGDVEAAQATAKAKLPTP